MKLSNIKAFARIAKQTLIKHSPEILMGIGGITFVATVIVAAKETIDEQDILDAHEEEMLYIDAQYELDNLDDKAYKKSKFNVYKDTTVNTTVNYIPSVILGTTSLACFFGAFGIMRKRYATLAVAYTALEESFRKYRQRVIDSRGVDEDIYYLTGTRPKEITSKDDDGNKTKKKQLPDLNGPMASPYTFKFGKYKENGERNNQWSEDQMSNMAYLLGQQDYLTSMLYHRCMFDNEHKVIIRGSVMLNEIRDLCGEDPTPTGAVVGNLYSNGEPGRNGFVDFRLVEATEIDPDDPEGKKIIPCVWVNPNVDGMIYDLLGKKEKEPFTPCHGAGDWGEDYNLYNY